MKTHYIRLLTDIELNDDQKHVWYRVVERFIGDHNTTEPTEFIDTLHPARDELEGDEDFPYVYVVYLNDPLDIEQAEAMVEFWNKVYPGDYEIESSAEYDSECDCDTEIDDAMFEEIKRRASKFLHNRWVEDQVHEGWRYGLKINNTQRTDPRLRDWDSLNEQYRKEVDMDRNDAVKFFKRYSFIFV
jgi:hypothetical protein